MINEVSGSIRTPLENVRNQTLANLFHSFELQRLNNVRGLTGQMGISTSINKRYKKRKHFFMRGCFMNAQAKQCPRLCFCFCFLILVLPCLYFTTGLPSFLCAVGCAFIMVVTKLKPRFRPFKTEKNEIKNLIKLLPWCFGLCFCVYFCDFRLAKAMFSK